MKSLRCCLILILLGLSSTAALANGIDPKATMGGGGTCANTTVFSQNSLTQAFTGLQTGCINDFQNNILDSHDVGVTLDTLVVNVTSPFFGQITCAIVEGSPLNDFTPNGSSPTSCTFFDSTLLASITPGRIYGLTFDVNFGPTVDIILAQTVIPEPATMLLLGTGLPLLLLGRKRFKVAGAAV